MVRGERITTRQHCACLPRISACCLSALCAVLPFVGSACTSTEVVDAAAPGATLAVTDEALRAEFDPLIAQHNERVSQLTTLEARGIIEIRYRDESGSHFEQTDIELSLASGGRGSLKLSKLGDLFWIGGDGRRAWIFDLRSKPPTAVVSEGRVVDVELSAAQAIRLGDLSVLSPMSLRFVMGLAAIPSDARVVLSTQPAASKLRNAGRVSWFRSGVEVSIAFGADGFLSELELRDIEDPTRPLLATIRISDYKPAHVDALSQLAWPRVGTRIRLSAAVGETSALLVLNEPWAQVRRMKDRYFDLTALMQHFQPETVSYVTQPAESDASQRGESDASQRGESDASQRGESDASQRGESRPVLPEHGPHRSMPTQTLPTQTLPTQSLPTQSLPSGAGHGVP